MKRTLINIAILSTILGAGMAQAGGWDRSGQDTSIILKEGNLLEVTSISVKPTVTGTFVSNASTGDGVPNYSLMNLGFRTAISEDLSLALIQDTPFGAEVDWTEGTRFASFSGVKAKVESSATTALVGYDLDNITLYGGLKSQSFKASASNPWVGFQDLSGTTIGNGTGYSISSTAADSSVGYVLGGAIEKPEIAMKVSLTYHSKVSHDVSVIEVVGGVASAAKILSAETPESVNLDFQTGIAENTLLFGSIRHVKWTQLRLSPVAYDVYAGSGTQHLKEFTTDTTSYNLGLGRKFSDQWSAAVTYGSDAAIGGDGGPLGPTDGYSKMGLGVTYSGVKANVTLGVQQVNMGDTTAVAPNLSAEMTNNKALVTAIKVAYKF
jgi:long-subunit fatty acid transport protein